jgi:anti-anti-sigma factor
MNSGPAGKKRAMDEPDPNVEVTVSQQDAHSDEILVAGELTEAARRPLVRAMTDLMLTDHRLHRVQVDTTGVTFMNSAGMSVLVQLQKMGRPRGIELVLIVNSDVVTRPLQLSGLWHRFTIVDRRHDTPGTVHEATHQRTEHS